MRSKKKTLGGRERITIRYVQRGIMSLVSNAELREKLDAKQDAKVIEWLKENRIPYGEDANGAYTRNDLINRSLNYRGLNEIVLIRGLPGSGKSTIARREFPDHVHLEADMYFERSGEYQFDGARIKEAHQWCQGRARSALEDGHDVVVANTFTTRAEMKPYFDMGHPIRVILADGNYGSIHDVPAATIARMRARWEPYRILRDGPL